MENAKVSLQETLLPALVQCFGIIFLGYVLGRTKVLGKVQVQGLTVFVQYLALPALIFVTVSTIPFTEVKWTFIASVFVSKAFIFICVALFTMLLTHPCNLGKAGIYAMSATQSNDFALGYPLFVALYQHTHPEYPIYLYIIAPVQLLILNTIGFFFLEVEKHSQIISKRESYLCHVLKDTFKNPVVAMTIVGLIWNVTYGQKILPILDNILRAFSTAFPATALFLVGYTMTVRSEKKCAQLSMSVLLVILIKNLILPLILQKFTAFMLRSSTAKEIQSYSSFAFLYGTIPTAPTVYVFASQYDTCIDMAAKTVVASTLFSAPLMFASASVASLSQVGIKNLSYYLTATISYLSIVNILCCIWLILIFCIGKRWRSISIGVTFNLVLAQSLMAIGGLLSFFPDTPYSVLFHLKFVLTTGSIYATRMSTLLLAIILLVIRMRSLCFILQIKKQINIISIVICFIVPYGIAASLLLGKYKEVSSVNFQLGFVQSLTTFLITFISLSGTIVCVILQQIYFKKNNNLSEELNRTLSQNPHPEESCDTVLPADSHTAINSNLCNSDIEDLGRLISDNHCLENGANSDSLHERLCDFRYQCSLSKRAECSVHVSRYIDENNQIGTGLIDDEYFVKHITLLILFGVAMTISLFICFWDLLMEAINGIFIELEFLDVILNYSLGIVCFIMFGLDTGLLKSIKNKFCFRNKNSSEVSQSNKVCHDFVTQYYRSCKEDIERTKIVNNEPIYIFHSADLTIWLLDKGITETKEDANSYIGCLLDAKIIQELDEKYYNLSDLSFLKFANTN